MKAFFFFLTVGFSHLLVHPASITSMGLVELVLAPGTPPVKSRLLGFRGLSYALASPDSKNPGMGHLHGF